MNAIDKGNLAMAIDILSAISESEASGEIAELYADIRATLNVSAINYVWRHIATIDGGLRWAWEAARPMFISGRVESECEHLQAQLSYPELPILSDTALTLAGVSRDGRDMIVAILDTYNRGNLLNMVSLSALIAEPATPPAEDRSRSEPRGGQHLQAHRLVARLPLAKLGTAGCDACRRLTAATDRGY